MLTTAIRITRGCDGRYYLSFGGVPVGSRYGYYTREAAQQAGLRMDLTGRVR